MPNDNTITKQQVLLNLLESGANVKVYLDPRVVGVALPDYLRKDAFLMLEIGYNLVKPINDLDVAADALCGTLSFGGIPYYVIVPWRAIFGLTQGNGNLTWPLDMPAEVQTMLGAPPVKSWGGMDCEACGGVCEDVKHPGNGCRGPVGPASTAHAGGKVVDLMSRRTPKAQREVMMRLVPGTRTGGAA